MTRTRTRTAPALAAVAATLLLGCGGSGAPAPSVPLDTATATPPPGSIPSASTQPTATTAPRVLVRIYLTHAGELASAHRSVIAASADQGAVDALLAGTTPAEQAADISTAIPGGIELFDLATAGQTATATLSAAFFTGSAAQVQLRQAQVTYTLTQFSTITSVRFAGAGSNTTQTAKQRNDFSQFLPAIFIEQPAFADDVHSPLHVTGSADVYEAQFVLELHDSSGRLLSTQQVHATSGTGTRGTFDATVVFTQTGNATLVAYERSPEDGSPLYTETIPVTLD